MNEEVTDATTPEVSATELAERFLAHREQQGAKLTAAMRRCDPGSWRFTCLIDVQEPGGELQRSPDGMRDEIRQFIRSSQIDTNGEEDAAVAEVERCLWHLLWESYKIAPEHNVHPPVGRLNEDG